MQVRRRAQSFLDLLANPSAWDLRVRMGTMAKVRASWLARGGGPFACALKPGVGATCPPAWPTSGMLALLTDTRGRGAAPLPCRTRPLGPNATCLPSMQMLGGYFSDAVSAANYL